MSVTFYVALPFIRTDDGLVPGPAQECPGAHAAIARAQSMARMPGHVGAIAFQRTGDPNLGEFGDAEILKRVGETPDDVSEL